MPSIFRLISGPVLLVALVLLVACAVPARAQSVTLHQSELWKTFSAQTPQGQPLCALGTAFDNGRQLYVKWFEGADNLVVQLFKTGWAIGPDTSAPLVFRLDRSLPWRVRTVRLGRVTDFLEFPIGHDEVRAFTRDFTASNSLAVEFPGGNEATWTVDLQGSSAAMEALVRCIERVAGPGDPRQPYAYLHAAPPAGTASIPSAQPSSPRAISPPQQGAERPVAVPEPFVPVPNGPATAR